MNAATKLRAIKLAHTLVWAFFAGCVLALPFAAWLGAHRLAARYTEDRRANFDIYLPLWLARNNQRIFGSLYFAGLAFAAYCWLRDGGGF